MHMEYTLLKNFHHCAKFPHNSKSKKPTLPINGWKFGQTGRF